MMYEQNRKIQSPQSVDEIRQIKSCGIRFSGEFGQCVDDQHPGSARNAEGGD